MRRFRPGLPVLVDLLRAAIVAGVVSTLAQIALWLVFTDALPEILYRDARLAAAILLGPEVLQGAGFDSWVMAWASLVHFALSFAYAAAFCTATARVQATVARALAGLLLGALLYAVNMHLFTAVFPWFAATRDPITFAAHLVFGVSCVLACRGRAAATRP